jgi:hypothetical protein
MTVRYAALPNMGTFACLGYTPITANATSFGNLFGAIQVSKQGRLVCVCVCVGPGTISNSRLSIPDIPGYTMGYGKEQIPTCPKLTKEAALESSRCALPYLFGRCS